MKPVPCVGLLAGLLAALPTALAGQLSSSSSRAVGLGDAYVALARGYEAVEWNPALLGMADRPKFSLNLFQGSLGFGSNSYGLSDFQKYRGKALTTADKDTLLALAKGGGTVARPLTLDAAVGATTLAVSAGRFAASLSANAGANANISTDALELALFGNATRLSPGQSYVATGTSAQGWAAATLALSYGHSIFVPIGTLSVGATAKLARGLAAGRAEDLGSMLQNTPQFSTHVGAQALVSRADSSLSNGSGLGLDVGGVYQLVSGLRLGLTIENLLAHMSWTDANLRYYRKEYQLVQNGSQVQDSTLADIRDVRYNPSDPRQRALHDSLMGDLGLPRVVRGGAAITRGKWVLAGGALVRLQRGLGAPDAKGASAGAEFRPATALALRLGLGTNFQNAPTVGGGIGLSLGPVHFDAALSGGGTGQAKGFRVATGLSLIH